MNATGKQSGPIYFSAFRLYEVPLTPEGETVVPFSQTRDHNGYFVAHYNSSGQIDRVDSIDLVSRGQCRVSLNLPRDAGERVFFHVRGRPSDSLEERVCGEVEYEETTDDRLYFEGVVDESGMNVEARLIERKVVFSESYEYWENGQLQSRIVEKEGAPRSWRYDEKGVELSRPAGVPSGSLRAPESTEVVSSVPPGAIEVRIDDPDAKSMIEERKTLVTTLRKIGGAPSAQGYGDPIVMMLMLQLVAAFAVPVFINAIQEYLRKARSARVTVRSGSHETLVDSGSGAESFEKLADSLKDDLRQT